MSEHSLPSVGSINFLRKACIQDADRIAKWIRAHPFCGESDEIRLNVLYQQAGILKELLHDAAGALYGALAAAAAAEHLVSELYGDERLRRPTGIEELGMPPGQPPQ